MKKPPYVLMVHLQVQGDCAQPKGAHPAWQHWALSPSGSVSVSIESVLNVPRGDWIVADSMKNKFGG